MLVVFTDYISARTLGLSKNTVKRYLHRLVPWEGDLSVLLLLDDATLEASLLSGDAAYSDERFEALKTRLDDYTQELGRTGVTRRLLWEEYRLSAPSGYGYTQFCYHLQQHMASGKPSMVLEHKPGDKLYPYSDYGFVYAVASQRIEDFIEALCCCLEFLEGVPGAIVPDNLKSAVVKTCRYEPEINTALAAENRKLNQRRMQQHYLDRSPEYYLQQAQKRSPVLAQLVACIFALPRHPEQLYKTCDGLIRLQRDYPAATFGQACNQGFKVAYFNLQKLLIQTKMSRIAGAISKLFDQLANTHLIIIDDFGLTQLEHQQRLDLMEIIEDRHSKQATIIASQMPVAKWYELIDEPTLADAILDRLIHTSHRIELKGDSLRKKR